MLMDCYGTLDSRGVRREDAAEHRSRQGCNDVVDQVECRRISCRRNTLLSSIARLVHPPIRTAHQSAPVCETSPLTRKYKNKQNPKGMKPVIFTMASLISERF